LRGWFLCLAILAGSASVVIAAIAGWWSWQEQKNRIGASLMATSLVGFALGNDAYFNLVGQPVAESTIHELLDPPGALFADDEEPAT